MQVPADTVVDYIVVGAGSAGSVIANKLSENGRYQVLLLEQGKPDSSVLLSMPKGFGAVLAGEEYVARYPVCRPQGEPTSEVWLRGKTLGGSSAVNGMIWARPRPEGMARLAKAGGEAWAWHNIEPLLDELDGGGSGPGVIKVSTHARHLGIVEAFVGAAASAGLARRQGIRDKAQEEVAYPFYNIDTRGRRCSAATGFLKGARKRPNLSVETAVRVDRIVFDGGRAHALLAERHGHRLGFSARREIILCAGALESPQILQRSGIGPRAVLDAAGIPVVCEREGVGRNLREHFLLGLNFQVKSTRDSENREYAGLSLVRNLARYFLTRKGPMAQSPCHAVASLASGEGGASVDVQSFFAQGAGLRYGARCEHRVLSRLSGKQRRGVDHGGRLQQPTAYRAQLLEQRKGLPRRACRGAWRASDRRLRAAGVAFCWGVSAIRRCQNRRGHPAAISIQRNAWFSRRGHLCHGQYAVGCGRRARTGPWCRGCARRGCVDLPRDAGRHHQCKHHGRGNEGGGADPGGCRTLIGMLCAVIRPARSGPPRAQPGSPDGES